MRHKKYDPNWPDGGTKRYKRYETNPPSIKKLQKGQGLAENWPLLIDYLSNRHNQNLKFHIDLWMWAWSIYHYLPSYAIA